MREVIAVCRSTKRSRERVASILDAYLWRIGDRTWRGRASNACLDRLARELRRAAKRNTAVSIFEVRSARASRRPLMRIGAARAFLPDGRIAVATRSASRGRPPPRTSEERHRLAILRIAALLHDLGKATVLFQRKLAVSLKSGKPVADPVRHELVSAAVWDALAGDLPDDALIERLKGFEPEHLDTAWEQACNHVVAWHKEPDGRLDLAFIDRGGSVARAIGLLILTHHRLPEANPGMAALKPSEHVRPEPLGKRDLAVAEGVPFWREPRWRALLGRAAADLVTDTNVAGLDMALRTPLMLADHLGSASSEAREGYEEHLANTKDGSPADSLSKHVDRVYGRIQGAYDLLHRHADSYPALEADQVPIDVRDPAPDGGRFSWQAHAADTARTLCASAEGGFFACLIAGTGSGKTRGGPAVLAAAAMADVHPERRYLRMTLALGLRTLADQSARAYVEDLGFASDDVAVLIGEPPLRFEPSKDEPDFGSESLSVLPDWLRVEVAPGSGVPLDRSPDEERWLVGLSMRTDRGLPATLDLILEQAGRRGARMRDLIAAPIVAGTIDHLMPVAAPLRSRHLLPCVRVRTADLLIDEIDQFAPEDIAAIARLVYQAGAGGRRVLVMSATLTPDISGTLHAAYEKGWHVHAAVSSMAKHVHVLCAGDAPASCAGNTAGEPFLEVFNHTRQCTVGHVRSQSPARPSRILPPTDDWPALVKQIEAACDELHLRTASKIEDLRVSVGLVRMTRIAHTAALAAQLPAGAKRKILRVKLCLHANFPRLHRSFIEMTLAQALRRKGADPDAGLRALLGTHGILRRARDIGCDEVQVVVVTSPVIETGNDLDFDWAIIDPSSLRAVVQTAGRVWRHRLWNGEGPNVLILGRSAIVLETGLLARPGVETRPHKDTLVARPTLARYPDRSFEPLVAPEPFDRIDATIMLDSAPSALAGAEGALRGAMLGWDAGALRPDTPLERYLGTDLARCTARPSRMRMFRRQVTRDIVLFLDERSPGEIRWQVDLAPGTRFSAPFDALDLGLEIGPDAEPEHRLIEDLDAAAWSAYSPPTETTDPATLKRLTRIRVIEYTDTVSVEHAYTPWLGITRGRAKDVLRAFGKSAEKQ